MSSGSMGTHTLDRDQRRALCVGCAASALWVATAPRLASAALLLPSAPSAPAIATAIVLGEYVQH